jgi:hypothetical protein
VTAATDLLLHRQAPIYGGIAAGWSLSGSISDVRWDTSNGRLRYEPQLNSAAFPENIWQDEPFTSSLVGGRPLVRVIETPTDSNVYTSHRGQNDAGYVRFERMRIDVPEIEYSWRALTPDGVTHYFGHADFITGATPELLRVRAPLTSSVDAFGNAVEYRYSFTNGELRLDRIDYTVNEASGVAEFATVDLLYSPAPLCAGIPVGSQSDFKTGVKLVDGASRLSQIVATAKAPGGAAEHIRQITLSYSSATEACNAPHSPYRQLASIQESAWHVAAPSRRVDLPAVTFGYGSAEIEFTQSAPSLPAWGNLANGRRFSGSRWPAVDATMLDLDGDSRVDRIVTKEFINETTDTTECGLEWWRNTGSGWTLQPGIIQLPRLPWLDDEDHPNSNPAKDEGCGGSRPRRIPTGVSFGRARIPTGGSFGRRDVLVRECTVELDSVCGSTRRRAAGESDSGMQRRRTGPRLEWPRALEEAVRCQLRRCWQRRDGYGGEAGEPVGSGREESA